MSRAQQQGRKIIADVESRGNNDLEKPVAIRPTSETVMYPCEIQGLRPSLQLY